MARKPRRGVSGATKSSREKTVKASGVGPLVGKRSEIAIGADELGGALKGIRRYRVSNKIDAGLAKRADLLRTLLGLQRANAVDHSAARLHHVGRRGEQLLLNRQEGGNVALALDARDVRMTTDSSGR